MRFLIHSTCGDGLGLAQRLQLEGHEVFFYCKEEYFRECGKGIVEHMGSLKAGLARAPEAIIFDMSGDGETADELKKEGYPVLGAGKFNDLIEFDRSFGMDLCKKVGISVPEFSVFKKSELAKAYKFIEESGKTYVLKPDNNLALDLTYVSKDAEDMIKYLHWCEEQKLLKGDFLLQEKVEGVEVSTEVWFSHGKPLEGANGTMEVKKFIAGNLGPATGCESSIVWPYKSLETPIVSATIAKLFPILEKMAYTGPLDINSIVAPDGTAYFLEFTPRFGYSAIYALTVLLKENLGDTLMEVAIGEGKSIATAQAFGMSLTISIPPYPLDSGKEWNHKAFESTADKRIVGLQESSFFPYDVKKEKDEYRTAGRLGLIGYLSNSGETLQEACNLIYNSVKELEIPDIQYRIDGADRAEEDLPKLKEYGYEIPEVKEKENVEEIIA
jgi:phosphoribosylamine---glycine ligase